MPWLGEFRRELGGVGLPKQPHANAGTVPVACRMEWSTSTDLWTRRSTIAPSYLYRALNMVGDVGIEMKGKLIPITGFVDDTEERKVAPG